MRRMAGIAGAVMFVLLSGSALAQVAGNPKPLAIACALNSDKSALVITAGNPSSINYQCMVQCKYSVNGSPALRQPDCRFRLPANAAEKAVCSIKGSRPGHFTRLEPMTSTCVPR